MIIFKKIILIFLSVFCLVGCDYSSKKIAKEELKGNVVHSYIGGSLQFVYAENSGGMLSLGSHLSTPTKFMIFIIFVSLMLALLFASLIIKKELGRWETFAIIFILSGGEGNLID